MSANNLDFVSEYWTDAWQRGLLTLDVLRQRGNIYHEHNAQNVPNVLSFKGKLVLDGRTFERPVNYVLAYILPVDGKEPDPSKRPFIVVDPRAGHGPGIGGMKQDSEVGVAMAAGHPCYFVGFLPEPMPGQTIEDVCRAEAIFAAAVAARHPDAEGKPAIIANCQAGWQTMISAALQPDHYGPIVLAGSPLSYWAGVHGKNPMRYSGGTLGGTWLTALTGDLGNGVFDGANLVANFESLNPANTLWEKPYGVYSKVDTEAPRFLEFETWWGSPVLLNAVEMQWIADNLFVGNKLATGGIRTSDGINVDLRNIKSPIVVFSSWGDNITPPQQALGWVLDLYDHEREIISGGQTIIYTTHQSIGHLGIFVSGKIATKEHAEFASCMDMIDLALPGLYEAVITEVEEDTANRELIHGRYLFRLESRTLDDIRALGGNDVEDDRRFAATARVSDINLGLYRTFAQPAVRALANESSADALRQLHPHRLRFALFSDRNPLMASIMPLAEAVRTRRKPVTADNPLLALETAVSGWISTCLDNYRSIRDAATEAFFLSTYGSPLLQAAVGLRDDAKPAGPEVERDLSHNTNEARLRSETEDLYDTGGVVEAVLRSLIYVRSVSGTIDERGFSVIEAIRAARQTAGRLHFADLKMAVRKQYLLVYADADRALATLPRLLPSDPGERQTAFDNLDRILAAKGALGADEASRLQSVRVAFKLPPPLQAAVA